VSSTHTHCFSVMSVNIIINHTLSKTRFIALLFCRRQYGSNFNHCDVNGPRYPDFGKITQNNGHYAVQGNSRSPTSIPMESPYIGNFLCVSAILHRFRHMADYWSNFRPRQGMPLFNPLVGGEPLNSGSGNLAIRNLIGTCAVYIHSSIMTLLKVSL